MVKVAMVPDLENPEEMSEDLLVLRQITGTGALPGTFCWCQPTA